MNRRRGQSLPGGSIRSPSQKNRAGRRTVRVFATRRKGARARSIDSAPLPSKYLYFCAAGARLTRRRSTDSSATCSARVPEPHIGADAKNSDVPSDGASLPCPSRLRDRTFSQRASAASRAKTRNAIPSATHGASQQYAGTRRRYPCARTTGRAHLRTPQLRHPRIIASERTRRA